MRVELVQEVEDDVSVEGGSDDNDVFLVLRSVTAVRASLLLSLHPGVGQLLEL